MATEEAQTKAARNQALFRTINEQISRLNDDHDVPADTWEFICECSDVGCSQPISLTSGEYEAVRLVPTHFPVTPAHVQPDVERVVLKAERYWVVEKFGHAGVYAIKHDPRRS
jgi:hypothetical protein